MNSLCTIYTARPCVRALTLTFVIALMCGSISAQKYSAIFQHSDADTKQTVTAGWENFLSDHTAQRAAGYRLLDLETARRGGNEREFHGIYTKSPLLDSVGKADSWAGFIKLKRKMARADYTMIDVAAVVKNEEDVDFYGVWVKSSDPTIHKVWYLNSREVMLKKTRDMAKDRFKIKKIHVVPVPNGEPAFVVLYHFSPINRYNFLYFADTPEDFEKERLERVTSQVQLIDYAYFREGDIDQYVGIFQDGNYEVTFLPGISIEELKAKTDELVREKGMRLSNLSVE